MITSLATAVVMTTYTRPLNLNRNNNILSEILSKASAQTIVLVMSITILIATSVVTVIAVIALILRAIAVFVTISEVITQTVSRAK